MFRVASRTSRCIGRKVAPIQGRASSFATNADAAAAVFQIPDRKETVLLGCVSYDPAVSTIWEQMRAYMITTTTEPEPVTGVPTFDFCLFTNYEQQVRALVDGTIDVAWNGPLAHVLCEQNAPIVSLGMRDVDRDFESVVVVKRSHNAVAIAALSDLKGAHLLTGAADSPQAHVVPLHFLTKELSLDVTAHPYNADLGKHGDTAAGEVQLLEALANNNAEAEAATGAVVSRMMWDRAINGQLPTVDAAQLQDRVVALDNKALETPIPKFDHCQFDALQQTAESGKLDDFYTALHAMDFENPDHRPIMELEGIQRSWMMPRQEGYDVVRAAMGSTNSSGLRATNFAAPLAIGSSKRAFSTTTTTTTTAANNNTNRLAPKSRVGVIGCGVAGLQAIRSLRARGYEVTAFDKAQGIGGLWRDNYDNFGLQVGKQFFEMPDLDMDEAKWGEQASGPKVQAYIQRFAKEFDLNPHVRLDTGIDRVSQNDKDGTWTFHTTCGTSGKSQTQTFDYCVVATGLYSTVPFEPTVAGRDSFAGSAIHSSLFRDATVAKDERVVVVGGGKSAADCATSAANAGASSVTLVQRSAHWQTPSVIAGLIPFQHVFLSRLGQMLVEAKVGVYPGSKSSVATTMSPLMGPIFAIVEAIFAFQLRLQGDRRPKDKGVVEDFYGYASVQNGTFKAVCDQDKVKVVLGEIETFSPNSVRLHGEDEEIEADRVIFATGFGKDFTKVFEPSVVDKLDVQKDGIYLYKRMLPPSVPGLAFVGETATIFNCTSYGIQSEWLARTLAGETEASDVDREEMIRETNAFKEFARKWMPETSSRSALVLLHQLHYHDQLLEDMGEDPARKSNPVAEYFGSYYSRDYNNIVGRPARKAATSIEEEQGVVA